MTDANTNFRLNVVGCLGQTPFSNHISVTYLWANWDTPPTHPHLHLLYCLSLCYNFKLNMKRLFNGLPLLTLSRAAELVPCMAARIVA